MTNISNPRAETLYGFPQPTQKMSPLPIIANRAPAATDTGYPIGQPWVYKNNGGYELIGVSQGLANWQATSGSGGVVSVSGTANQITSTNTAGAVTLSLPAVITAPGSLTASTTLTATLGSIIATNGNFVAGTQGTGILLNSAQASGAAASPVVVNGRSGRATFNSVSIAAGADLTLTITNSAITASTTEVMISMSGATTGSALSIKSKIASSGSLAIVVTNGTGATTTTADIQIDFLVLNA